MKFGLANNQQRIYIIFNKIMPWVPERGTIFAAICKIHRMLNTVIFDMDGLLIDSEPLWQKAGMDTLELYGGSITVEQYHGTTGLRTREWIEYWFNYYGLDAARREEAVNTIENKAIEYIHREAVAFPGTKYILDFFRERGFRIGLATSSPMRLIEVVVEKLGIGSYLDAISSAEKLSLGKPHPQVYINCADTLQVSPHTCLCFEDSFNGVIAAKAARMRCVAVPVPEQLNHRKWGAADYTVASLEEFTDEVLAGL